MIFVFTATYAQALIKLKRLEKEESVLTADSDEGFSGKQDKIQSAVRQMKLKEQSQMLKETYCSQKTFLGNYIFQYFFLYVFILI